MKTIIIQFQVEVIHDLLGNPAFAGIQGWQLESSRRKEQSMPPDIGQQIQ